MALAARDHLMPLPRGSQLGRYEIVSLLGAGGRGEVYLARDERLEREVALKVLPAGTVAGVEERRRFRKEALSLSRLDHPNIESVHDFDSQEGVDFLVLEYVPGQTLRERLRSGPLPLGDVNRLGRQLLEGLAAAHARGVVHRDLKPENIRVTPEGRLKILDFGLATLIGPAGETATTRTVTEIGAVRGTPPYMAPEQLRGETVDARTDLFATGSVLYEMATGRRPFAQHPGPLLIEAILHQAPPPPRTLNPSIPEGLEAILLKALEKDPENRYQSAAGFLADLEAGAPGTSRAEARAKSPAEALAKPGVKAWTKPWPARRTLGLAAAITVVFGTLAGMGIYHLFFAGRAIDSLAVLPFQNQDADPEAEYLSDGITETIINNVSQLPAVKVIARTSAFRYKGRRVEPREAARDLGVRAVLTGYVQRRGEDLVVSAELVDTQADRHLWGQRYTTKFSEILRVEEDIAARISEEMRLRLTGEEKKRLARRHTESPLAHELYLKGRHAMADGSRAGLHRAVRYFEEALEIDPRYALAHVGIAEAYYFQSTTFVPPHEAMPRVRDAARDALRLDGDLGEAHAALAVVTTFYEWNWDAGEAAFKRALRLNPGHATAHLWYGLLLGATGRSSEALAEMSSARELDPLSPLTAWYALYPLYITRTGARRYDLVLEEARRILEKEPGFFWARNTLALIYQMTGRHAEAIAELEAAVETAGDSLDFELVLLGHAYGLAGERERALEVLKRFPPAGATAYSNAFGRALLYLGLGDLDSAFVWLERAYDARDESMVHLGVDPRLDVLRDDPRFQVLLRRLRLDQIPSRRAEAGAG